MGASVSQALWRAQKAERPPASDSSDSEELDELDERALHDSALLALPSEVLERIVRFVAAEERDGTRSPGYLVQHGWRGRVLRDYSMPGTSALALSCKRLSQYALEELWQQLDVEVEALGWLVAYMRQDGTLGSLPLAERACGQVLQRNLHRTTALRLSCQTFGPPGHRPTIAFQMDGLRWIGHGLVSLRSLALRLGSNADMDVRVLVHLQSLGLRLSELSFLSDVQKRKGVAGANSFWTAFESFLLQQSPTLTALTLHWQPAAFPVKANADVFDIASSLSCPVLRSFDYVPFGQTTVALGGIRVAPLRVLSVHHCRLSVVASLLSHVKDTLEVLHLHYEPPRRPYLGPDDHSRSNYHYLSSSRKVTIPAMVKLDRLVVEISKDRDGAQELRYLLSSFKHCPIRQLWIRVSTKSDIDGYWYEGVITNLGTESQISRRFSDLVELRFAVDTSHSLDRSPPLWPTEVRRFWQHHQRSIAPRDLDLRITGVRGGMQLLHGSVIDVDTDDSETDSVRNSDVSIDKDELDDMVDDWEAGVSGHPNYKPMSREERLQSWRPSRPWVPPQPISEPDTPVQSDNDGANFVPPADTGSGEEEAASSGGDFDDLALRA